MHTNFWKELKQKPIFSLAPMEDVTDTSFRQLVLEISDPEKLDVLYTEFTNVDGLLHDVGRKSVRERLIVSTEERRLLKEKNVKLVAQIWGSDPEKFYQAAKLISKEYDFDGIDINMGCPAKKVVKNYCCSSLILVPEIAKDIVQATKEATLLPVSVKTRTGFTEVETESWISHLMQTHPAAIILHGRTRKMMSKYPADWNEIKKAVDIKNSINPDVAFLGNGDVTSYADGISKINQSGVDGIMVGRGIFANPWFFNPDKSDISAEEKINTLWRHTQLFTQNWDTRRNFNVLKRFYKIYAQGFPGAASLRAQLMECQSAADVKVIVNKIVSTI
ncbi:MAG: tRNA-dihydrouridine synthase [Bacteroidales bacterium]|nr:tRNA-dihydrouridine synthase [Bacteroidales bacterium]